MTMKKVLLIRFSSFGDIVQALPAASAIKQSWPEAELHWLVRADFQDLVKNHPAVNKTWILNRQDGLKGLIRLSQQLAKEQFTHVYDAHNNLRSRLLALLLRWHGRRTRWLRRPKNRLKRLLLFRFRLNLLPQPFVGQLSYLQPLTKWKISSELPLAPQFFCATETQVKIRAQISDWQPFVALVPGAAWELKRWPVSHWRKLISLCKEQRFVILGGQDEKFCEEIQSVAPERVRNFAGLVSLAESCAILQDASSVVSNDTGLLHVADSLGLPTVAIIGPTAFGYPARATSRVAELDLPCKPCSKDGRGRCRNPVFQKCLRDLSAEQVRTLLQHVMADKP